MDSPTNGSSNGFRILFGWTKDRMDKIVEQLPPSQRDGSILIDDGYGDIYRYLAAYLSGIIIMAIIWQIVHFIFKMIKYVPYMEKHPDERGVFVCIFYQNIFVLISSFSAAYNVMFPNCENPYPLQFFFDDVCFMTVDRRYIYTVAFTQGYLTYDLYSLYF